MVPFEERDYGNNPLTASELEDIIGNSPIEKFLNTRTPLYREKNLKQKPPTKEEAIRLMVRDPNLLRRPVIIKGKETITGFTEAEVKKLI